MLHWLFACYLKEEILKPHSQPFCGNGYMVKTQTEYHSRQLCSFNNLQMQYVFLYEYCDTGLFFRNLIVCVSDTFSLLDI